MIYSYPKRIERVIISILTLFVRVGNQWWQQSEKCNEYANCQPSRLMYDVQHLKDPLKREGTIV